MRREAVVSSNIESIGWDDSVLEVEFHSGDVYRYFGVGRHLFIRLMSARSKGEFLHQHVKGNYPYGKKCACDTLITTRVNCRACGGTGVIMGEDL